MKGLADRSIQIRGIFFITLSAFLYAVVDVVSIWSGDIPAMQKVCIRNAVVAIFSVFLLYRNGNRFKFKKKNLGWFFARALAGLVVSFSNIYAVDHMALADATIIHKLSPMFVLIFSFLLLGEKIDFMQFFSIIVAFAGALFVIKPSMDISANLPALAALASAVALGIVYPIVRKLRQDGEDGSFIVFFFSTVATIISLPFCILNYTPMTGMQLLFTVLSGIFNCLAQLAASAAFAICPGKEITVYEYSQIVFAALLGFVLFGQLPDAWSAVGYVIIIGISILLYLHNKKLAAAAAEK